MEEGAALSATGSLVCELAVPQACVKDNNAATPDVAAFQSVLTLSALSDLPGIPVKGRNASKPGHSHLAISTS